MELNVIDCGQHDYAATLQLQYDYVAKVQAGDFPDTLLLVEHQPVITMGRHANGANLLFSAEALKQAGIDLFHIERGGDATYHGPGQLVGYPIFNLKKNHGGSIKRFVQRLEEVFIRLCAERFGLTVARSAVNTGVWHEDSKLVAMGLAVQHAVTFHGFAFNVNTNLAHFNYIVPCGLVGKTVTSLQNILGRAQDMAAVKLAVVDYFGLVYCYEATRQTSLAD